MNTNRELEESFFNEARKRVGSAESYIVELERNPENTRVLSLLSDIFHPILGLARFLDLPEICNTAFALEAIIKKMLRHNVRPVPDSEIKRINIYLDCLKDFIFQRALPSKSKAELMDVSILITDTTKPNSV